MGLLRVLYDLKNAPLTFDFAVFLAIALNIAKSKQVPVSILILADVYRKVHSLEEDRDCYADNWRLKNIIVSILTLAKGVGSTEIYYHTPQEIRSVHIPKNFDLQHRNLSPSDSLTSVPITINDLSITYSNTKIHPEFIADNLFHQSLISRYLPAFGRKYVSLTLRFSKTSPPRNTTEDQLRGCLTALRDFYKDAIEIIGVADQDATVPNWAIDLFQTFGVSRSVAAELDLSVRCAIYEQAVINISWNTGPVILLYLHKWPYLVFGAFASESHLANIDFLSRKGPRPFEQLPWSNDNCQFIDWTDSALLTGTAVYSSITKALDRVVVSPVK
jgi:hypothetical protein